MYLHMHNDVSCTAQENYVNIDQFLCFVLVFPQLYFHMLRQRRKVLHGEVIVEKDE